MPTGAILLVARHEILSAWRSRVLVALTLTVTALLVATAWVGWQRRVAHEAQRARYRQIVEGQFQQQPDRHPHRVAHYGFLVFRPPGPLSFFDTGVETFTGTSIFLEAHRQNTANFSDAGQSDGTLRFGELTPAAVLQVILPLLIFVTAGTAVTRERELGTLSLLLAQGLSGRALLAGKVLGTVVLIAAIVAPGLIAGLLVLATASGSRWSSDLLLRIGSLGVMHATFALVCAAGAVVVSSWCRSSRSALLVLVGLWLTLWVVVPRMVSGVAQARHPLPSRAAFDAEIERRVRELGDSHNPDDPRFAALRLEQLRRHGVSRVEELPTNYQGLVMLEGERLTTEAYREHREQLLDRLRRQNRILELAAWGNPYLAVRLLSMALCGTDIRAAADFDRQAEDYRFRLAQRLNELHMREVHINEDRYSRAADSETPSRKRIDRRHWKTMPMFEPVPVRIGVVVGGWLEAATPLLAWLLAASAGLLLVPARSSRA
jgi:ABC-2 type transport system permease protein